VIDQNKFQSARLFPVTGIKGSLDQERRTTSVLLATMKVVPELSHSLLRQLGAPRGTIETFIEPEFKVDKKTIRPDGFIIIKRGKSSWSALVEVKTGSNDLDLSQINAYLDLCRDHKIDALLTISNQVLNASGSHPTPGIDQRKLRTTKLEHLSWLRVITESIILSEHQGLEDTERDFILKELIRFLQSKESGASEFNDMGASWATVREGIRVGAYRKADDEVLELVSRFESLVRYTAFTLSARLGVKALEVVPRLAKSDYKKHLVQSGQALIENKTLMGAIEIPGAASKLGIRVDLGSGHVHTAFSVEAPEKARNTARINWLVKQLRNAPNGTIVSWTYKRARSSEKPHLLADLITLGNDVEVDKTKEISSFEVALVRKMGTKRMGGQGSFIDSVVESVELAYGELLQNIKPWQAPAPKLSSSVKEIIPDEPEKDTLPEGRG